MLAETLQERIKRETQRALERCNRSLDALADTPEEVEAAITERLLADIGALDAEGATMAEHDWDGLS